MVSARASRDFEARQRRAGLVCAGEARRVGEGNFQILAGTGALAEGKLGHAEVEADDLRFRPLRRGALQRQEGYRIVA